MRQGGIVAQLAVLVARDVVDLADGREDFRLLDGVDAEIGFQIQIEIEHVLGIAGLLDHQGQDALLHRIAVGTALRRSAVSAQRRSLPRELSLARSACSGFGSHGVAAAQLRRGSDGCGYWRRWCGNRCCDCSRRLRQLRDPRRQSLIAHAQRALHHFQIGGRTSRHPAQPGIPGSRVGDAIGVAQRIRAADGRRLSSCTQRSSVMLICEPNPAPRRSAYSTG